MLTAKSKITKVEREHGGDEPGSLDKKVVKGQNFTRDGGRERVEPVNFSRKCFRRKMKRRKTGENASSNFL